VSQGLRSLIIRKSTGTALKTRAAHDGMETLRQDGWRRVQLGQTTIEEVLRVTQSDEGITETD
jgi:type II secretory ATPase GspE/PulE/Tfp pilus assembly ATPase PilB-like protein